MSELDPVEAELNEFIATFYGDPLGFVKAVYPWGEEGTVLSEEKGPDSWQKEVLIGASRLIGTPDAAQIAVASGHGVGKTCLVAWIIHWFISTRANPQIVVTANTKEQLTSKTWRELAKWHKMSIHKDWFTWTATKFYKSDHPEDWFASAVPWSSERSEAFAGTHERDVLLIFDEASAIDDVIWEVAQGAMTTAGAMHFAFGNPTRNSGRFKECWGQAKHRWTTFKVDSRTAKMVNRGVIDQWVEDYGEDSDFVRVRVRGEFPRSGAQQLIPADAVETAMAYEIDESAYRHMPIIFGCDVARFGDDQSVIVVRQGRKHLQTHTFRGLDTVEFSAEIVDAFKYWNPYSVFVDEGGVGAGVVDQLYRLGLAHNLIPVTSQRVPSTPRRYFNKRAEMWCRMRDWIISGADLLENSDMHSQLTSLEYSLSQKDLIQLESKRGMKARGVGSPDLADALALTFAEEVLLTEDIEKNETTFAMASSQEGRNSITGY